MDVSTHSRLKAAGSYEDAFSSAIEVSTHSRLKAAGTEKAVKAEEKLFQHTAA